MRKILPFTVTDIGGKEELKKWKEDQIEKEALFQIEKEKRFLARKESFVNGLVSGKIDTFYQSEADKQFKSLSKKKDFDSEVDWSKPVNKKKRKKSFLQRMYEQFLELEFNQ